MLVSALLLSTVWSILSELDLETTGEKLGANAGTGGSRGVDKFGREGGGFAGGGGGGGGAASGGSGGKGCVKSKDGRLSTDDMETRSVASKLSRETTASTTAEISECSADSNIGCWQVVCAW